MKAFLTLIIFLSACVVQAQNLFITGTFDDPHLENTAVNIYKPVDGGLNIYYNSPEDGAIIEDGRFAKELTIKEAGFLSLENKYLGKVKLYVIPGDTIHVHATRQEGKNEVSFSGNNAEGHDFLKNVSWLGKGIRLEDDLDKIFHPASSIEDVQNGLAEIMETTKENLQNLSVSEEYLKAMELQAEAMLYSAVADRLWIAVGKTANERELNLSKSEIERLIKELDKAYNPFQEKYRNTTSAGSNAIAKGKFIMEGILEGEKVEKEFWEPMQVGYHSYAYAPAHLQKHLMGGHIIFLLSFNAAKISDIVSAFSYFKEEYPDSEYVEVINEMLNNKFQDTQTAENKEYADQGYFDSKSDSWDYSQLQEGEYANIQEYVKANFEGSPVFVDIWATWCSPCLAEFAYVDGLHEVLEENGIEMLYMSVNREAMKQKWVQKVKDYQLSGYHLLADKDFVNNTAEYLGSVSSLPIPRYLLFDENGNLLIKDALRPSSGKALEKQITAAMD